MERVPVAAVFDTGPLIYLDALGYLGIACGLLRVVVPDAVSGELARRPEAFGGGVPSLEEVERRTPAEEDMRGVSSGPPSVGAGESEVIAVALGMGAVAVIDDRRGVRRARRLGVEVVGTLSVVIEVHRSGLAARSFAEDLEALDEAGMYLTEAVKRGAEQIYRGLEGGEA